MGVVLAGIAPVEFYDNGTLVMTAKVPTDSALNVSVSEDVIRGGNSNQRISSYFYDSNLAMTVTSPTFDKKYLANKLGSTIESGANVFYVEAVTTTVSNTITVADKTPVAFFEGDATVYGWYKLTTESDDEYKVFTFTGSTGTTSETLASGSDICVKYAYADASGSHFNINSEIIPNILTAVMKIPELKGDTKSGYVTSTKVGEMTVTIPQYQLDPNTDLAITSSGHATISLSGNALINDGVGCDAKGFYARVDEVISGANEYSDVSAIVIEDSDLDLAVSDTQTLSVLKLFKASAGKLPSIVSDYTDLTFESSDELVATVTSAGVVEGIGAGTATVTVTVTAYPTLVATALVTVTA